MQNKPNVLIFIPQHVYERVISGNAEELLHSFVNVRRAENWAEMSEEEHKALFDGIDGVLTSWGVHPFPEKAFLASDRVKILSHAAGGVRWVPREALEKGVVVTNGSEVMSRRISEMCLAYALMGLHNVLELIDPASRTVDEERPFQRKTLYGKTIGLVGFGWIARNFVQYLAPFNVTVLAYDPYVSDATMSQYGVRRAGLEEVFTQSQVISIHAGDTDETRKMIGPELIRLIPDSAVFINTARGGVVDHDALVGELRKRRFVAYLDVTDPEPLPEGHELFSMKNVVLTYHRAGSVDEPMFEIGDAAVGELKRFFAGEPLRHEVKLEWYDRMT